MFVLDTNVVSELRRPRPHPAVADWMSKREGAQLKVAAATVGEIQVGVERTRTGDPVKAAEIESWLVDLIQALIPRAGPESFQPGRAAEMTWASFIS
jgi:predicted nucleic acid-binding protein